MMGVLSKRQGAPKEVAGFCCEGYEIVSLYLYGTIQSYQAKMLTLARGTSKTQKATIMNMLDVKLKVQLEDGEVVDMDGEEIRAHML